MNSFKKHSNYVATLIAENVYYSQLSISCVSNENQLQIVENFADDNLTASFTVAIV